MLVVLQTAVPSWRRFPHVQSGVTMSLLSGGPTRGLNFPSNGTYPHDSPAWSRDSGTFCPSINIAGGGGLIPLKGLAKVTWGVTGGSSGGGSGGVGCSSEQVAARARCRHAPRVAQVESEDGGGRAKLVDLLNTSRTSRWLSC